MSYSFPSIQDELLNFPDTKINPAEKGADYHRQFAEVAYSFWYNDQGGKWGRSYQSDIDILRAYGDGDQPISIYEDMILGKPVPTESYHGPIDSGQAQRSINMARANYTNINWIIYSPYPKMMRLIKRSFANIDHDVDCETMDPRGVEERMSMKHRLYVESKLREHDLRMAAQGVENVDPTKFYPESLQELEFLEAVGKFKLHYEIAMERVLDKSFYLGKWKQAIKNRVIEDLVNLNCIIVRDDLDKTSGAVVPKYTDPKYFVGEYSRRYGFTKSRFMGELTRMTVDEIGAGGEFTDDELREIARGACGQWGNMTADRFEELYQTDEVGNKWKAAIGVYVLDTEFKDVDYEYMTTQKTEGKPDKYYRSTYGKIYDTPTKKTKVNSFHVLRRVKWVVGTKYVFDFGLAKNIKRPTGKTVSFSWHPFIIPGKSLTAQAIPVLDELELNYLSKQNALAKASPPGMAIDISAIQNVKIGGKKHDAWDSIAIAVQSGNFIYNSRGTGDTGYNMNSKPYEKLTGGLGGQLNEFIANQQQSMADLREIMGITLPASASGNDPKMGLGVSELAMDVSNDAMFELLETYAFAKESVAMGIYQRIRAILKNPENKSKYGGKYPISTNDRVILDMPEDDFALNIEMRMRNNTQRSTTLLAAAMESLKAGKNGYVGITQAEYGLFEQLLDKGRVAEANQYLAWCETKHRREAEKEKAVSVEQQGQQIQAQIKAKFDGEIAKIKITEEEKRKSKTHATQEDIKLVVAKSQNATIPEMMVESELEANGSNIDKN